MRVGDQTPSGMYVYYSVLCLAVAPWFSSAVPNAYRAVDYYAGSYIDYVRLYLTPAIVILLMKTSEVQCPVLQS